MSNRRVVITGIGIISPVGNNKEITWANLIAGKSGVGRITAFDPTDFPSQIAGEVKDFDPETIMPKKELRRIDRFSMFALAAAKEAWEDSGLEGHNYTPHKMGAIIGVGIGGLHTLEENFKEIDKGGSRKASPFLIPAMISNLAPGHIAIQYGLKGVNYALTSACTSGTHALGEAFRMIREGLQDVMVTGGSEAAVTVSGCAGFGKMKALSTRNDEPERASRPFDRDRDGFVIGEGGAVLVLEELEVAKARGAKLYAEVIGYGFSCDAFHITAPPEGGEGAIRCMEMAIEQAGIPKEQIGYVNAHGTSTPVNDPAETSALKKVFGDYAKNGLLVSSTKSMTGHLLGAAGGLEGAISALVLKTGIIPPTINLENPDDACDLDYVANEAREVSVEAVMSNSFGFGGTNGAIILKRI